MKKRALTTLIFVASISVGLAGAKVPLIEGNPINKLLKYNLLHENAGNGHIQELNINYKLYSIVKDDVEGYSKMISGSEFFTYPSIRDDVGISMIARATTGKMGFEFLTGAVPKNTSKDQVTFTLLSDIDLNQTMPFNIEVNGKKLLTFHSNEDGTLSVTDNPGFGEVEYVLVKRDANGDGLGIFRLTVPITHLEKGEKARVKFLGAKKNSNSWIMIFKAKDVVDRLKKSVDQEAAFLIKQIGDKLVVDAPAHFSGKEVFLKSDGKRSVKTVFENSGEISRAQFEINAPLKSFLLSYGKEKIDLTFKKGDGNLSMTDIRGPILYHHKTTNNKSWTASLTKLYRPEFYVTYDDFFDKKFDEGLVSVMNSSHQDIAWVDRPEVCIILRDTLLLRPILKDAFIRDDYGFDIEDGLMLREYLERHPDAQEKITTLLNKKLISVGATYNCPYEDMYDAEDQVRQLYLGKKWVKKNFGGYDSKVYWNVDVPGKSLQTPQILKKAGVDYMVISRHGKGMFYWESPDGSSVFTYSPGHYGNDLLYLSRNLNEKLKYGAEQVLYWQNTFKGSKVHAPLLSSQDMLPAIDYSDFIESWNSFESLTDETGKENKIYLPDMELMTVDEFLPLAEKNAMNIDTIRGERPNVWVYIHGPGHHEAISASREGSKLLPAAEKFLTIANKLDPLRMPYPYSDFDEAWQAKIYPDHGWGGHDGDITDNLFKENLVKSKMMGEDLLTKGITYLAGRVETDSKKGIPLVVFNSLSWMRSDPVSFKTTFTKGQMRNLSVISHSGKEIPVQTEEAAYFDDGSLKSVKITFVAEDIPSIGYKTFYLIDEKTSVIGSDYTSASSRYENPFYQIQFEKGGIAQVFDKKLQKELFNTKNLKVGDVFTLQSVGNGAGEFGDIQQTEMIDFDKVSFHNSEWELIEKGPVFSKYKMSQQILHAIVDQEVTVYHGLKRIYFNTSLRNWNGELFREFRTAFPIDMKNPEITYEVPFGSVKVGNDEIHTAGERYTPLCKDVHPRAIIDWISAKDEDVSVTVSSSVAAADWVDPTGMEEGRDVLQHILLASRVSCHFEGNEYSQAGQHNYSYVLTSNEPGSNRGKKIAKQKNEPLQLVYYPVKSEGATLPEELSFFSVDNDNVIITTIKKAEDTDESIVRMYNVGENEEKVNMSSFFTIDSFKKTNIIEENPVSIKPELEVGKFAIETYSLGLQN